MAPRTAKAKKATEVSEAPKKGRGKTKTVEEMEPEVEEQNVDEKTVAPEADKKKRGKKAGDVNGLEENGKTEDAAPPAKKGRKKNVEEPPPEGNDEEKAESMDVANSGEDNDEDETEANGDSKETSAPSGRGRKKQTKKEPVLKAEPKSSRGRKAKQETEPEEAVEEKSKPANKGRGRKAQPKAEPEPNDDKEEETKPDPPAKGRKKAPAKPVKEKSPEIEEPEADDEESQESEEPPKKKETKSRRNVGKKVQIKDDSDEKDEEIEEASAKKRKNKKEEKGKGDSKDEEAGEEIAEAKPKGRGRGKKAAVEPPAQAEDDAQDDAEAPSKRRRKPADDKAPADDKKKPPPKNKAATNYEELNFENTAKSPEGKDWNFKISSWNVDGIRAWMNKGGLDYIKHEKPDILCLQETKCAKDKLPEELADVPGYHAYWECSKKEGYAGVGIYTTQLAMNVQYGLQNEALDDEGRIITAEYEQFYLICTYVPNAGKKLVTLPKRLQWNEEFLKFVKELDKKKPVIICGDMNVSHQEIDLANPKTNKKNAGFTEEERAGMTDLLGEGFVDTFRHLYPEKTGAYTFWTYMMNSRSKNVGWRLDYFIVSERLLPALCDNVIRDQVYGSDHCPISLLVHLKGADKPKE